MLVRVGKTHFDLRFLQAGVCQNKCNISNCIRPTYTRCAHASSLRALVRSDAPILPPATHSLPRFRSRFLWLYRSLIGIRVLGVVSDIH